MVEWLFHELGPKESQRESTVGAFFTSDAIGSPIQAIIREGIQNTLDAAREPSSPVKVRIYLSGSSGALDVSKTRRYFSGGKEHWESKESGLGESSPMLNDACPFLVFEDFGTRGLEGDYKTAHFKESGGKNHFYHFFRAEGQSDKEKRNRGSWGVGKHVFLMNSAIRAFFGYTIRANDKEELLMGRTVLKMHSIRGKYYQDGFFAVDGGEKSPYLPIFQDSNLLTNFKYDFKLKRNDEPGLSIVVPWIIEGSENAPECGWIAFQVIKEYYLPIIVGELVVEIECDGQSPIILDSSTAIRDVLEMPCNSAIRKGKDGDSNKIKALLTLAEYAVQHRNKPDVTANKPNPGKQKNTWLWDKELFDDVTLKVMKTKLDSDGIVGIRIPLDLWKKGNNSSDDTFFSVYLQRNDNGNSVKTEYIREGIVISKGGTSESSEYYSMLVVESGPLANMLRLSENPSHTEWQYNLIKESYAVGTKTGLDFIKRSARMIASLLVGASKEEDKSLLSRFFSVAPQEPSDEDESEPEQKRDKIPGDRTAPQGDMPASKPRAHFIERTHDGFRVVGKKEEWPAEKILRVAVAYDTNRGDPFKKYSNSDFSLEQKPISIDYDKAEPISVNANILFIRPSSGQFSVAVSGFDINRQVIVSTKTLQEDETNDD